MQSRFIPARRRAHHASAVEQRVEAALQRDAELGPLFSCNETVSIRGLDSPLFGWIKKHPSASGLLYVVDEAQTFFPSQKSNLSLNSGIRLAAQARKYGLGMIVATQAPKGINNQIVSNCRTQFFGLQNAPATIAAAQDIIAASGGRADDLGKLKAGEFYFKTEGSEKPGKIRTPLCLTFHPPNPPSPEEVIARAKRSAERG